MTGGQPVSVINVKRRGIVPVSRHLLWSGVTAVLLWLSYPWVSWGLLAHVALVPMAILALRSARWRRLAWTTWLVGFAWWLVMIRWMMPVTAGGTVALSAFMALFWSASMLTFRGLVKRWHVPATVALPMAWVTWEMVRARMPAGGFGWFTLAHTQATYLPDQYLSRLIQVADLLGEPAVGFLVAMTSGFLVDAVAMPWVTVTRRQRKTARPIKAALAIWLIALTASWGYGQARISQAPPAGTARALNVAVVQTNVPQSNKRFPTEEQMRRDWRRMLELVRSAAEGQPQPHLIVTPETMVPAALNPEARSYYRTAPTGERGYERYFEELRSLSAELDVPLLVGAHAKYDWREVTQERTGQTYMLPARRYNAAYLIQPDPSAPLSFYSKVHRVPFGEYIPWVDAWPTAKDLFMRYLSPYEVDYSLTPGESYRVLRVAQPGDAAPVRFATPICFEDTVPRVVRQMAYGGGQKRVGLLVNLTNDGWFAGPGQQPQHIQIATLRCIENRVPMARSVNTGISGFVDSSGRVLSVVRVEPGRRATEVEGVASRRMLLDPRRTVFGYVGLWPMWAMAILTLGLALVGCLSRVKLGRSKSSSGSP